MSISQERPNQLDYLESQVLSYMEHQAELFEQMRSQLIAQYLGKYALFENGQVLDVDDDYSALVVRSYGAGEPRPLFIKKVLQEEPRLVVRTPFKR
jgi:hypothetical protein